MFDAGEHIQLHVSFQSRGFYDIQRGNQAISAFRRHLASHAGIQTCFDAVWIPLEAGWLNWNHLIERNNLLQSRTVSQATIQCWQA